MYEARIEYDWNHTSSIMWIVHKMNADPKRGKKLTPNDFHPGKTSAKERTPSEPLTPESVEMLKQAFGATEVKVISAAEKPSTQDGTV